MLRAQAFFLAGIDKAANLLGRPLIVGHVQRLAHALDQALLILRVQYLKTAPQPGLFVVQAQHAMCNTVEGAHPHGTHRKVGKLLDAPTHLGCRLVGERDGEDGQRRNMLDLHQPRRAVGEHARFAAAGAGEYEAVVRRCGYCLALGRIQAFDDRGNVCLH